MRQQAQAPGEGWNGQDFVTISGWVEASPEAVARLATVFRPDQPGTPAELESCVPLHGSDISIPARPLFQDRTLMGTFYGAGRPRVDFPWLLELYQAGRLKLDELVTRFRPVEEVNEAFEDMVRGVTTRTVLTFD